MAKRSSKIKHVADTIKKVEKHLLNNQAYTIWIYFKIGSVLTLCNSTANYNLYSSDNKIITNLLMSLEYSKNGSGQANNFTLNIAYTPNILNVNEFVGDINYIDRVLSSHRDCTLRYGYCVDGEQLLSPEYSCSILDFDVSIENQIVKYTITGYSAVSSLTEKLQNYPRFSIEQTTNEDGSKNERKVVAKNPDGTNYEGDTYDSILNDTNAIDPIKLAKLVLDKAVGTKTDYGYKIVVEDDAKANSLSEVKAASNVSVFEYVNSLLKSATDLENSNKTSAETTRSNRTNTENNSKTVKDDSDESEIELADKTVFGYEISEPKEEKTITIYKYDPNKDIQTIDIVFDIMNEGNSIVKSFETSFKGSVLAALVGAQIKDENNKPCNVDEDGTIIDSSTLLNVTPIGDVESDINSEAANWATAVHHCYKATLSTMGLPCEIPINTKFNIKPIIYTQQHHTGGYYMCTKSTDTLDSSGFTTTLELMKLDSSEVKNFKKSLKKSVESADTSISVTVNNIVNEEGESSNIDSNSVRDSLLPGVPTVGDVFQMMGRS